jgi:hypothetical protein
LFFLIGCSEFIIQLWEGGLELGQKLMLWLPFNEEERRVGRDVWEKECGDGLVGGGF